MTPITTIELLQQLSEACGQSDFVEAYTVQTMDDDILNVRVHLQPGSFINVFYNLATDKVAFALIAGGRRLYGKDNAKMGWHVHPFENPEDHHPCSPTDFETFLKEVLAHYEETTL